MDWTSDISATVSEQEELAAERTRTVFTNLAVLLGGAIVAALLLVILLWNHVPPSQLLGWLLFIVVWNGQGIWMLSRQSPRASAPDWARLGQQYEIGCAVAGVIWGVGFALFFSQVDAVEQSTIVWIMIMVTAGAVSGNLPTFRAGTIFLCALLIPTACVAFWHGGRGPTILAMGLLTLLAMCIHFTRAQQARISREVLLRLRNETLARRLAEVNTQLEHANSAKTRFLAAANHDLRQPMHAISLLIGALRTHTEMQRAEGVQSILRKIQGSVEVMDALFGTVLDISKLDAGAVQPRLESFRVNTIFDHIELHYGPMAEQKGIALKVLRTDRVVRSDPALLDRIVRNFVSNAIRYTSTGRVLVGTRRRSECVEVQIWDTGVGIPSNEQQTIFEEFIQLKNPTHDRRDGLGLGLSIVQRTAALLQHQIGIRSEPGRGSLFFVRVPFATTVTARVRSTTSPPLQALQASVHGCFVVVIDDEEDILLGMQALLEGYGCSTVCAVSSGELVRKLEEHERQPDLIVCDLHIGTNESGIEAIRRIRESQELDIPAIVVTGSSDDAHTAAQNGFIVVSKPVTELQLLTAMTDALHKHAPNLC